MRGWNGDTVYSRPLTKLLPMITWDDYLEQAGLTVLHKIVCNLSSCDLETEVAARPEEINKLDIDSHRSHSHPLIAWNGSERLSRANTYHTDTIQRGGK